MKNTPLEHRIIKIAGPVIKDLGFEIVMLEFKGGILQILAENPKTGNLSLDECTAINKMLSPVLEVEDPISGPYTLEISSPGIDRPLTKPEDFKKYAGFDAKVELDEATDQATGQKRFRGKLVGANEEYVAMIVDNVEQKLEIASIKKARLVLTDDLIKATKKRTEQTETAN